MPQGNALLPVWSSGNPADHLLYLCLIFTPFRRLQTGQTVPSVSRLREILETCQETERYHVADLYSLSVRLSQLSRVRLPEHSARSPFFLFHVADLVSLSVRLSQLFRVRLPGHSARSPFLSYSSSPLTPLCSQG
jgi:hypothetical protein